MAPIPGLENYVYVNKTYCAVFQLVFMCEVVENTGKQLKK